MALPIALQVYSVREYAEKDFKGTMEQIKAMGYAGVELAGLYGYSAVEIKKILDEVGLTLVSAHVPIPDLEKDAVLDEYASVGLKYIVIPWMQVDPDEKCVAACLAQIKAIAVRCKERGMQLLYHNHDFEFEKVNGEYILDTYYREISADLLQTELDTCWVNVGGEKPNNYVRKYSGRAPIVHLKDFAGQKSANMYALIGTDTAKEDSKGQFEFRPIGYGLQDVGAILQASEDAGASWLVVEQDSPSMDKTAMECAKLSIDYLKANYIK